MSNETNDILMAAVRNIATIHYWPDYYSNDHAAKYWHLRFQTALNYAIGALAQMDAPAPPKENIRLLVGMVLRYRLSGRIVKISCIQGGYVKIHGVDDEPIDLWEHDFTTEAWEILTATADAPTTGTELLRFHEFNAKHGTDHNCGHPGCGLPKVHMLHIVTPSPVAPVEPVREVSRSLAVDTPVAALDETETDTPWTMIPHRIPSKKERDGFVLWNAVDAHGVGRAVGEKAVIARIVRDVNAVATLRTQHAEAERLLRFVVDEFERNVVTTGVRIDDPVEVAVIRAYLSPREEK